MEQNAPHNARFKTQVKGFYAYLGAVLFALIGPFAAQSLIDADTMAARVTGVVFGTIAWMPLIVIVGLVIHQGDEFVRRMHLVAIAYAFALSLVLIACLHWLARAWLIEPPDLMVIWLAIGVLWVICLFASKAYFERQQ